MTSYLLSIGDAAERSLSTLVAACSCGAALPISDLNILHLSSKKPSASLLKLMEDIRLCRQQDPLGRVPFLPSAFSLSSCVPSFPSVMDLSADKDTAALLSALRGKGVPLSYRTDREAVEWGFSALWANSEDPVLTPLFSWLALIRAHLDEGNPVRLALLADLVDPYAAGIALVLLNQIRCRFASLPLHITLVALAETESPLPESFHSSLASSLLSIEERHLLRNSDEEVPLGADAMAFIALPSSMTDHPDSFRFTALAAARMLGRIFSSPAPLPVGLHTLESEGTISLHSLQNESKPFALFLEASVWLLNDLLPALTAYSARPGRLRSLAPNVRNGLFRHLWGTRLPEDLAKRTALWTRTLSALLREILAFLRAVPASLRFSQDAVLLWQKASDACGRYITVASELDVVTEESHESGLDTVRPVHRDSLADTDEEQLQRRLQEIAAQVEEEKKNRDGLLAALGGYRSLQVRQDCLSRCRSALLELKQKAASFPPETEDHSSLPRLLRRIRLLEAAIARCELELSSPGSSSGVSSFAADVLEGNPYAGLFLDPSLCHSLEALVSETSDPEMVRKDLSDRFSTLLSGFTLAEPKTLVKDLASRCHDDLPSDPFLFLLENVGTLCNEDVGRLRILSVGNMPPVPLLPDLLAESDLLTVRALLSLVPVKDANPVPEQRGLLAMLLLLQYRRLTKDNPRLLITRFTGEHSPVLRFWLSSRHAPEVSFLSLQLGDQELPFVLVMPDRLLIPAHRTAAHATLVPSFVTWFNPANLAFRDPVPDLSRGDRKLLLSLLPGLCAAITTGRSATLQTFLSDFLDDLANPPEDPASDPFLKTRLRSVCGLSTLPAYTSSLSRVTTCYERALVTDEVLSCLTGIKKYPAASCAGIPDEVLYTFRNIPFAREDSNLLLDSPHHSEEAFILNVLDRECRTLSASSDDYRDAFCAGINSLLDRFPVAAKENRAAAESLLKEAQQPLSDKSPSLSWPWDPLSPSIQTLLGECLGSTELTESALNPFSDLLTLFPARGGEVIGDTLLSALCMLLPEASADAAPDAPVISPDAILPPLSPGFARSLCCTAEGRLLLNSDFLSFRRMGNHSLRVTMMLNGSFPLSLIRDYTEDEILHLYAHDIPTLAVWPSVPFDQDKWNAYFVYAHASPLYTFDVLSASDTWEPLSPHAENRAVSVFPSFPLCFCMSKEGRTAGALPNILPKPAVSPTDPVVACIDFGSSGTSVVFLSDRRRQPLHGPVMVRTLLNNPASSRDLLRREFLPAVPVSALLPTVSRIFRNVPGMAPVPFEDGIILMSSDMQDLLSTPSDAIYTALKWEEEKGRSGFLCLHQVMLMSALQARATGASGLSWRFALPDEMAREGREALMNLFVQLAQAVSEESRYPLDPSGLPIEVASESSALGAYFRFCAQEETRGGFMVLDIGSSTADISLFLRGREQAVRSCQIPLGVHYMLLPSLLRNPGAFLQELSAIPDETFRQDLLLLNRALSAAASDPAALRKARLALDHFIADHAPMLTQFMLESAANGAPARLGALFLLHAAFLLMLSGLVLLQIAADPQRNDFLPEQMSLCLSGRGSSLLEGLPGSLKAVLWHFLTMFRNRRVASLSLLFSSEKKMEIPVGLSLLQEVYHMLPPSSSVPASIAVRPEELLPEFLLRFRKAFPYSAEIIFPGLYTQDTLSFTERGEHLLALSIENSFPLQETPRPYHNLAAWIGNLLELM